MYFARLLYRSYVTAAVTMQDDLAIVQAALHRNHDQGITGHLWRTEEGDLSQFFQALHGPEQFLRALLVKLQADPRHFGIEVLLFEGDSARSPFLGWSMAYDKLLAPAIGVALQAGQRPRIEPAQAREIYEFLVALAEDRQRAQAGHEIIAAYQREPCEPDTAYHQRLGALMARLQNGWH